ncbi:MAG: hypothetical protein ACREV7_16220 [Steroidobacteraceae bacterium]
MTGRAGRKTSHLSPATVEQYLRLLKYLHRNRSEVRDALQLDPCPGQSTHTAAGIRDSEVVGLPYTPDVVAVPLVQSAIEFLSAGAIDVLRARDIYARAIEQARSKRRERRLRPLDKIAAISALGEITVTTPRGPRVIDSTSTFAELVDMLYAACFVVLAYLVGARASEIMSLEAGCVRPLAGNTDTSATDLAVIVGSIFKHEAGFHGHPHEWVAPAPAVHAISVLEALSAPHRPPSGRRALWVRPRHRVLTAQWQSGGREHLRIPTISLMVLLLKRFGAWLELPCYEGKPWELSTHQGRKTFARFVALRDRTSLFALAQHLGHRDRAITDRGYAGNDYRLEREIEAAVLDKSICAWEHMLSAPGLGGRMGAEIIAKRPHFRGARMKQGIASYARMLVEAGLILGVCDWGFCVYREDHSACLGNTSGPNPLRREPSTCARCKNFVVSKEHRPYWVDQAQRHEMLLNEPALPTQTLKIARVRLEEARQMIRSIDSTE